MRGAQLLACIAAAALATQPFAVHQVGAGQLRSGAARPPARTCSAARPAAGPAAAPADRRTAAGTGAARHSPAASPPPPRSAGRSASRLPSQRRAFRPAARSCRPRPRRAAPGRRCSRRRPWPAGRRAPRVRPASRKAPRPHPSPPGARDNVPHETPDAATLPGRNGPATAGPLRPYRRCPRQLRGARPRAAAGTRGSGQTRSPSPGLAGSVRRADP